MKKNIYLFVLLVATYSSAQKNQLVFSKKNLPNHIQSLNTYNKKYIESEADKRSFLGIYEVKDSISPQVTDYNNNPYRALASIPETEHFEYFGYCIPNLQDFYREDGYEKGCVLRSLVTGKFYQMRTEAFEDRTMYYASENMHPWKWVKPELPANIKAMMVRYKQYVKTMGTNMDAMVVIQHKYMTKYRKFDSTKCSKADRIGSRPSARKHLRGARYRRSRRDVRKLGVWFPPFGRV